MAPIYVGKGLIRTRRDQRHLSRATNRRLANVLAKIRKEGLEPRVEIVQRFSSEQEAFALERKLINLHGRADLGNGPLCNLTNGGEGAAGAVRSPAERARLKAQWATVGAAVQEGNAKAWADQDRRKLRLSRVADALANPAVHARRTANMAKALARPEVRARISVGLKATLASPEQKALRGAVTKSRWADPAYKAKTAAAIGAGNSKFWIIVGQQVFGSSREAAEAIGVSRDCITLRCRKGVYQRMPKQL